MPNWTENHVVIMGPKKDLQRFAKKCLSPEKDDKGTETGNFVLDFNKIIPKPKGFDDTLTAPPPLNVEALVKDELHPYSWIPQEILDAVAARKGYYRRDYIAYIVERRWPLTDEEKSNAYRATVDIAKAYERNVELSGCPTWYEWNCANWGTKWSACHNQPAEITDTHIKLTFSTAWDAPRPVYEKIKELFPTLKLTVLLVHEDGQEEESLYDENDDVYKNKTISLEV